MTPNKKTTPTKTVSAKTKPETCNVPDCPREPSTDGLCGIHWDTHRGLATPKEGKP